MRLLCLELKRLVKTRSTWMLLAAALILSAVLAYFPISFVTSYKTDARGNMVKLTGIEAIQNKKEQEQAIAGLITEEKGGKGSQGLREVLSGIWEALFLRRFRWRCIMRR